MTDETKKTQIKEAAEALGAEAYFEGDDIPEKLRKSTPVFNFSVHGVNDDDGKKAVGFHVDWPQGEPADWDADPKTYTSAQVAALIMSGVLQEAVISLLQRSQEHSEPANSTNGKSFDDFMSELNNIDNPPTKH